MRIEKIGWELVEDSDIAAASGLLLQRLLIKHANTLDDDDASDVMSKKSNEKLINYCSMKVAFANFSKNTNRKVM